MQRFKTTILLASILGILIVATIGASIMSNKKNAKKEGEAIVGINIDDITKIEIKNKEKIQILSKVDGQWLVSSANNAKADFQAINGILSRIKEMKKEELVSEKADKRPNYEVDEEKGVEVKLFKGEEKISDFFLGKSGSDFDSTYVRMASEDKIYATKGFIRYDFDRSDFRDLAIFKFDKEKVSEIKIEQAKKDAVILQKKDGLWKAQWYDKFNVDEDKAKSLLSSLANLSSKDIVYGKDAASAGLINPFFKITIKFEDGSEEALNIGGKIENDYYAKRSAADTIYILSESAIKGFQKEKDDFSK